MWHGPGVVRQPAQPRAVWHNAVGVWEGNRGWTQMGRVGGFAILGKSRNGNRISRRAAEALRGGIRVLCGSASLRDTFSAGGCVGRLGVVDFVWPVLKMCPDNSWNPVRIETERCPTWFGLLSDLPRNTHDGWGGMTRGRSALEIHLARVRRCAMGFGGWFDSLTLGASAFLLAASPAGKLCAF